jgi:hypothetical protein
VIRICIEPRLVREALVAALRALAPGRTIQVCAGDPLVDASLSLHPTVIIANTPFEQTPAHAGLCHIQLYPNGEDSALVTIGDGGLLTIMEPSLALLVEICLDADERIRDLASRGSLEWNDAIADAQQDSLQA